MKTPRAAIRGYAVRHKSSLNDTMSAHSANLDRRSPLDRIRDRQLLRDRAFIDGRWVQDRLERRFETTNPANGAALASVAALDPEQTRAAVAAAAGAFPHWKKCLPQERSHLLRRWFDLISAARDDLALIITAEQGKPLIEAQGEIDYAASFIEWYAEEAKRINVEGVTSHLEGATLSIWREPVGVVAVVTPWNFPAAMMTRKVAAALAVGCTVVAHPSSEAPLSALALAELGHRAGFPAGVFNVVTGDAATIVGTLCADAGVRAMSFTGSTEVGRHVAAQCAPSMKRLVLELGGHAPLIIFEDADLDKAVDIAIAAKFATSGQDCLAANRIYVQRSIYDAFCHALTRRVSLLKLGNGLDDGVDIGPLKHERAIRKVEEHVTDALARGARCLAGGRRSALGPLFYEPTLLADVAAEAIIMRQETFGPVAPIAPFETEDAVLTQANDSEFGLVAYVVTENGARQRRMARALEYGMVAVNRVKITGAPIPFGGIKQSGLGREGSRHGMEAFSDIKYVCFDSQ